MPILLPIAVYAFALVVAAHVEDGRKLRLPLLTIMTLGLVRVKRFWRLVAAAVHRLSPGEQTTFNPSRALHRCAALLIFAGCMALVFPGMWGATADADTITLERDAALAALIGTGAFNLILALLGVGWLIRRSSAEARRRLGLRAPTLRETFIGLSAGAGLWLFSTGAVAIWSSAAPVEVFEQQTAAGRQIFHAFGGSLASALMLAAISAIGEEILYRGALQPVFGVVLTSLFFTATHLQYALTPAALILFVVSLGFGWLRLRYCTGVAIAAHALYNLVPFLLASPSAL